MCLWSPPSILHVPQSLMFGSRRDILTSSGTQVTNPESNRNVLTQKGLFFTLATCLTSHSPHHFLLLLTFQPNSNPAKDRMYSLRQPAECGESYSAAASGGFFSQTTCKRFSFFPGCLCSSCVTQALQERKRGRPANKNMSFPHCRHE